MESSNVFAELWTGLSSNGDAWAAGLVCGEADCPLVVSGHVQLISKRMQLAHRGRASLHYIRQPIYLECPTRDRDNGTARLCTCSFLGNVHGRSIG
jgi:hypothetical protein